MDQLSTCQSYLSKETERRANSIECLIVNKFPVTKPNVAISFLYPMKPLSYFLINKTPYGENIVLRNMLYGCQYCIYWPWQWEAFQPGALDLGNLGGFQMESNWYVSQLSNAKSNNHWLISSWPNLERTTCLIVHSEALGHIILSSDIWYCVWYMIWKVILVLAYEKWTTKNSTNRHKIRKIF